MSFVLVMSSFTTSSYHVFASSIQLLNVFERPYVGKSMRIDINTFPLLILLLFVYLFLVTNDSWRSCATPWSSLCLLFSLRFSLKAFSIPFFKGCN